MNIYSNLMFQPESRQEEGLPAIASTPVRFRTDGRVEFNESSDGNTKDVLQKIGDALFFVRLFKQVDFWHPDIWNRE